MNDIKELLLINRLYFFLFVCVFGIGINEYLNYFHYTETVVYNTYSGALSYERIKELVATKENMVWLSFLYVPIVYILKFFYFACCLAIASVFMVNETNFKKNFNILLKAEFVFCAMLLAKVITIEFITGVNTLSDMDVIPLSLLNLINKTNFPKYLLYPTQLVNLWEFSYWFVIVCLIKFSYRVTFKKALSVFCFGYLPGLLLWVVLIIFLALQFS